MEISLNLAATYTKDMALTYPKFASPKYDGIRAVIINGQAWSRNGKLIPNLGVQAYFADGECDGFDGELLSGKHDKDVFKRTSSVVRTINGSNEWHFKVFDVVSHPGAFTERLAVLRRHIHRLQDIQKFKVYLVTQVAVNSEEDLVGLEQAYLDDGYEGVMLRNPNARYKNGRATPKSQDLLKVKRFEDSEAVVIGWEPLIDSKTKEIRQGVMGALLVRDIYSGVEFAVGSGFNGPERLSLGTDDTNGMVMTYQFFAQGDYTKPRFPTFKGFRYDYDRTAPYLLNTAE